jgi:P27 family predicted phage terminase small subunit
VARKAYKRAVQLLENRRTLVPSDEPTLELYAVTYEIWLQARLEIGSALMVTVEVADSNGHVRKVQKVHPLMKVMETQAGRLAALSSKLGFDQITINRCKPTADSEPAPEVVPEGPFDINEQRRLRWEEAKAAAADTLLQPERISPPSTFEEDL